MKQLEEIAKYAARYRIRGRSYKRNSLLKPLDFILDELEHCPDVTDANEIAFARASSKGFIFDHVKRIARGVHEENIYEYVDLFFDHVLKEAFHGDVNQLLQRERSVRSAYLVYMREALAEFFVANNQASNKEKAMEQMEYTGNDDETDDAGE